MPGETKIVPPGFAIQVKNRMPLHFKIELDEPENNQPIKNKLNNTEPSKYKYIPKIFMDCVSPSGGVLSHVNGLLKFCSAEFVNDPAIADKIHWHIGGEHVPTIATCHGFYTDEFIKYHGKYAEEINKMLFSNLRIAKNVISVSNWVRDELLKKDIDSTVIRSGIDTTEFYNKQSKDFGLFISYDCPEKNIKDAIEIARGSKDIKFIFIINNASKFNIPKNVKVLDFPQPHSNVKELLATCSFLLITSLQESGPIIAMEAMASGKPIVGYNARGLNELVVDNICGLLSEPGDIKTMIKNAEICLADGHSRALKIQKYSRVFDWRLIAEQIDTIYRDGSLPKTSAIILACNNEKTLNRTFESLPSWVELCVGDVDGEHCSIEPSHGNFDYPEKRITIKNTNPAANRNQIAKIATGKYLTILDADDFRLPGSLEYQVAYMELHPDVCATVAGCYRDVPGKVLWDIDVVKEIPADKWWGGNCMAHGSLVVRKSVFDAIGGYDPKLAYCEDYDLGWRLCDYAVAHSLKMVLLPIIAYAWTYNPDGRSTDVEADEKYKKIVIKNAENRNGKNSHKHK